MLYYIMFLHSSVQSLRPGDEPDLEVFGRVQQAHGTSHGMEGLLVGVGLDAEPVEETSHEPG